MIDTFQPGPESNSETGNFMIVHFPPNNPKIISHCMSLTCCYIICKKLAYRVYN